MRHRLRVRTSFAKNKVLVLERRKSRRWRASGTTRGLVACTLEREVKKLLAGTIVEHSREVVAAGEIKRDPAAGLKVWNGVAGAGRVVRNHTSARYIAAERDVPANI